MSAFTEANRKAFDDLASKYNEKAWAREMQNQIVNAIQQRKSWIGAPWIEAGEDREVKLLDYACGTGLITKVMGPWVKTIRGIDISENMVAKYNEATLSSGLKPETANAVVGDLFAHEPQKHLDGVQWRDFDIAVVSVGFHHFEDPGLAVKRLNERLKPGTGVLLIVDFIRWDEKAEGRNSMTHTIKHSGFDRSGIKKLFDDAGMVDFEWDVLDTDTVVDINDRQSRRRLFLARAKRAPTAWGKFANWLGQTQDAAGDQMQLRKDHPVTKRNIL